MEEVSSLRQPLGRPTDFKPQSLRIVSFLKVLGQCRFRSFESAP